MTAPLANRICHALYTGVLHLALPAILGRLWWRGRRLPAYRQRWSERFGAVPLPAADRTIWVHAVSVGEVRAALPLIAALLRRHRDRSLYLTTTTPTGSAQVRDALEGEVGHSYLPYDLPWAVARFLDRVRPAVLLLMETELWPNLLRACRRRGIPVVLVNARLSRRSARRYARLGRWCRTLLAPVWVAAQSTQDARRLLRLGVRPGHIRVTGNIKLDQAPADTIWTEATDLRKLWGAERPVLVAASTHPGEEHLVLDAFQGLRAVRQDLLLLLVPRHPDRFDDVARLVRGSGFGLVRRSALRQPAPGADVVLGDSMGEMWLYYAASDVAFVGGSLVPVGGHNVLEPALLGKPVVFGPHMFNFRPARGWLLQAGAAREVQDPANLAEVVRTWLEDPEAARATGTRGREAVRARQGVVPATLAWIEPLLGAVRKAQETARQA